MALVTGASSGIGKAIAIEMAQQGASVVVNYIGQPDAANEVVRGIEHDNGSAIAIEAGVSKQSDVARMISQAIAKLGRLDVIVNNAGIEKESPFLEKSEEEWDRVIAARRMRIHTAYSPVFEDWLFYLLLPFAAYATLVILAYAARSNAGAVPFSVGAAALVLLFVGIHNAWDAVTYHVFTSKRGGEERR